MLSAAKRLGSSAEIAQTLKNGKKFTSEFLVIYLYSQPNTSTAELVDQPTRFAFAVSKKLGNSVFRHRLTRQLRHVVHNHIAQIPTNCNVVIRVLPAANLASFSELSTSFKHAISKISAQTQSD